MNAGRGQPRLMVVFDDGTACDHPDTVRRVIGMGDMSGEMSGHPFGKMSGVLSERPAQTGNLSGEKSGVFPHAAHAHLLGHGASAATFDPHIILREFPSRWQGWMSTYGGNRRLVQRDYPVCEKTTRNWEKGIGGVNGGHVAIACHLYPDTAPRFLFGARS